MNVQSFSLNQLQLQQCSFQRSVSRCASVPSDMHRTLAFFTPKRAVQHASRNVRLAASASDSLSSSLLGGPSLEFTPTSTSPKKRAITVDDVLLESEAGIDFKPLQQLLKEGEFEKADDFTRATLIKLAGPDAEERGWVYFTEVKFISEKDLQTLDNLWKAGSDGKFGFSVQKELWLQNQQQWGRFFRQIDWTAGENNIYRKWPMEFTYTQEAPKGHLPLTNALRGTRLLEAILLHPAFEKSSAAGASSNTPDWLK